MDSAVRSKWILPKLKYGYLVEESGQAQQLAAKYVDGFFLTPEGECFHNTTVTGGRPASEGPLALKRDLRETEKKLVVLESLLRETDNEAAALTRTIEDLAAQLEARSEERRQAERDTANQGAALRQMEAEVQRIDRRLQEWTLQAARNKDAREAKTTSSIRSAKKPRASKRSTSSPRLASKSSNPRLRKCASGARPCSRKPPRSPPNWPVSKSAAAAPNRPSSASTACTPTSSVVFCHRTAARRCRSRT